MKQWAALWQVMKKSIKSIPAKSVTVILMQLYHGMAPPKFGVKILPAHVINATTKNENKFYSLLLFFVIKIISMCNFICISMSIITTFLLLQYCNDIKLRKLMRIVINYSNIYIN